MPRKKPTHVDDPAAAGRRLREARERAGLSQRDLAFPGCSPAYLSRIEAGARVASPPILRELARRLGVSEEHLARGRGGSPASALNEARVLQKLAEFEAATGLFEQALAEARSEEERSRAIEGLAHIALERHDLEGAVELFEEALALAGGDLEGRADLAEGLPRAYSALGRTARALTILERGLKEHVGEPMQYLRFAGLLGLALADNGNLEEAQHVLGEALARSGELAQPGVRARAYWSAARLRREEGDVEGAARLLERAEETLRVAEDTQAILRVRRTLAQVQLELGRPEEALVLLREGRALVAASGTDAEVAESRIDEARALSALGRKEEAAALAIELSASLEEMDGLELGRAYARLGELLAEVGERGRARAVLERAIERLEGVCSGRYLVYAYKRLAELLIRDGDAEGALEVLERSLGVQGTAPSDARPTLAPAERPRR